MGWRYVGGDARYAPDDTARSCEQATTAHNPKTESLTALSSVAGVFVRSGAFHIPCCCIVDVGEGVLWSGATDEVRKRDRCIKYPFSVILDLSNLPHLHLLGH